MIVIKCKMCGGSLSYEAGSSVCECEYCGTKQTIPDTDDEKRLKLYERANKLRINNEFDKAAGVYESIVAEFQSEAEAYWGLVLCKYGIEYVDDPKTGKKIPTCHRSSFDAVFDDANFDLVMENADTIARGVYREEAKQIEEIRKGIIEVSSKEEPYDIFICYKETADDGQRTIDSVIAQDVYDELTEKGYRVFFSRITLEDKLGQEYEPYIFAALNSAKVMLVFGTQYDYLNAVWVKNEWSRFLQLMESGQKKTLIPCYKNIDAYDMPKEFSKLQAQDMGKVGAIQDLIRGIDKIFDKDTKTTIIKQPTEILTGNFAYCERGFLFLEDHKWEEAKEYFDKALDLNPKDAKAYLGLFLVEIKASSLEEYINRRIENLGKIKGVSLPACEPDYERIRKIAKDCRVDGYLSEEQIINSFFYELNYTSISQELEKKTNLLINNNVWKKVERFAEGDVLAEINSQKDRYKKAVEEKILNTKKVEESEIERIKNGYEEYLDYKEKTIKEQNLILAAGRDATYKELCNRLMNAKDVREISAIRAGFIRLGGYKESNQKIAECDSKARLIEEKAEIQRQAIQSHKKENKKRLLLRIAVVIGLLILSTGIVLGVYVLRKKAEKMKTVTVINQLMENENYLKAIEYVSSADEIDNQEKNDYKTVCLVKLKTKQEKLIKSRDYSMLMENHNQLDEMRNKHPEYISVEMIKQSGYDEITAKCNALTELNNIDDGQIHNIAELYKTINSIIKENGDEQLLEVPVIQKVLSLNGNWKCVGSTSTNTDLTSYDFSVESGLICQNNSYFGVKVVGEKIFMRYYILSDHETNQDEIIDFTGGEDNSLTVVKDRTITWYYERN